MKTFEKFRTILAYSVLILLLIIFAIKFTSRAKVKDIKHEKTGFFESIVIEIDEHVVVNPYYLLRSLDRWQDIGKTPQKDIPKGVTHAVNKDVIPIDKKLLYTKYNNADKAFVIKLLKLNTNEVLHKWEIKFDLVRKVYDDWNDQYEGSNFDKYSLTDLASLNKRRPKVPTLLNNRNLLVNLQGMLVFLNKDSNIKWRHPKFFHHSLEFDHQGNLWATSYSDSSKTRPYLNDQIVKIDPQSGRTLYKMNIEQIFSANPNHDLSRFNLKLKDRFHINDVQPVLNSSKYWKKGDLFLSSKEINTVLLYRPSTNKILWHKLTGWSHQHDVEIMNDSVITVFDNNLIQLRPEAKVGRKNNRFVKYNFRRDRAKVLFDDLFEKHNVRTAFQGKGEFMKSDSLFYVEVTDQSFFVIKDLQSGEVFKCYIPGRAENKAANLGWFRLLD